MAKIGVQKDGPYMVEGIAVVDWNGNPYPSKTAQIALCRCGASKDKPYCDGTHLKIGFKSAEAAPPK